MISADKMIPPEAQRAMAKPPDQHGAGTAVTLPASFLGSRQTLPDAKPFEQGHRRIKRIERDRLIVQEKVHGSAHDTPSAGRAILASGEASITTWGH